MATTKATTKATTTKAKGPKPVIPTDTQRAVLDALSGGRKISISGDATRSTAILTTAKGTPVKDAPKLKRTAVESCQKKGWVDADGALTEEGKKAKRIK